MQFGIKIVLVILSDNVIFSFLPLVDSSISNLSTTLIIGWKRDRNFSQAFRQHFVNIVKTIVQPLVAPFRSCCDKINRQDQNPDVSSICS